MPLNPFLVKSALGDLVHRCGETPGRSRPVGAITSNDFLPMMIRHASQLCPTAQALETSSEDLKIQSASPLGPLTKPSTEIDIFIINFRMIKRFVSQMYLVLSELTGA
jgi:hypothetical protein